MPALRQQFLPCPTPEQRADIRLAASKMTGATRRSFEAATTLKYCGGDARQAESVFGWGRHTVVLGLAERRYPASRASGHRMPTVAATAGKRRIPKWPKLCVTWPRLMPSKTRRFALLGLYTPDCPSGSGGVESPGLRRRPPPGAQYLARGHSPGISPTPSGQSQTTKEDQRDRCHLRQYKKDDQALESGHVKRLSIDCKATVPIGDLSRGGPPGAIIKLVIMTGGRSTSRVACG